MSRDLDRDDQLLGALLRRLRNNAGLTQEELADAATVSARSVSDLERGVSRTARPQTARLIAAALGLTGPEQARFLAAARGQAPPDPGPPVTGRPVSWAAAATRALPRDIAGFTGRTSELEWVMTRLAGAAEGGSPVVGICAIGGMAGVGKTALAVHAAHQLAAGYPDGQFFIPLHGHTPGHRPAEPADALADLLLAAGIPALQIPPGLEPRAARWRDFLAGKQVLLVLDDAAGHDQVEPLLPGTPGSTVLVTSRRRLAALDDAAALSLDVLTAHEAADMLVRLAGRPGIQPGDPAVAELAELCGYLPLAVGMLASRLRHHPAWTPAQVAADLGAEQDRLGLMSAENRSVDAALHLSYRDLTAGPRRLFRRLGLQPGPDIDAHAAAAVAGLTLATARRHLEALYDQHLIAEPRRGRYQMHDLVREHARALADGDDPAIREAATGRLLDYYLQVALAAGRHIPSQQISDLWLPLPPPPDCAPPVSTHRQAAAWMEAERVNLQAAIGAAAASGRHRHATWIPAATASFLYNEGRWDQALSMLQNGVRAARQAGDESGEGQNLLLLGLMQVLTRDFAAAEVTFRQAQALYVELGDRAGQGDAIGGIGFALLHAGKYPAAAAGSEQAIELFREIGNRRGLADALNDLGTVQWLTGNYAAAAASAAEALQLFRDIGHRPGESDALVTLAIVQELTGDYTAATATLQHAMTLCRQVGDRSMKAFILNELGALQRRTGDYESAAASHQNALTQLRDLGEQAGEAVALNELGLLQQLTGDHQAAAANHQRALDLYHTLGDRLGQAKVLNSLGELELRTGASQQAGRHHARALAIARDMGVPLEEARALEGIGRTHLHHGHTKKAKIDLQQAMAIYQRIGAPDAHRVRETLQSPRARGRRTNLSTLRPDICQIPTNGGS